MIKIFVVDNDQSLQKLYSLILKEAGLRIKFLNEYPFSIGKRFPHSECGPDGVF